MNECKGIFGKIFGHSFRRYLLKEKYIQPPYMEFDIKGEENVREFLDSFRNVYIIRCKRCGMDKR